MQFIRCIQGSTRQFGLHYTPAGTGDWRSDFTGMLDQSSKASRRWMMVQKIIVLKEKDDIATAKTY